MRRVSFFLLLALIVLALAYCFKISKISSIECVSQFTKCNSNTLSSIEKVEKSSIIVTKANLKKALSNDPLVKKYSLQLKLNGKYIVLIEERIPRYCFKSGNETYFFDSENMLIKINGEENIKCVEASDITYKLGSRLNEKDNFLQKVFYSIRNISDLGRAYIDNGNLIVEYRGKTKLIFPTEGDAKVLAGKAYYTVSQFDKIEEYIIGIGSVSVSEIDFRYKDPVVRFI